VVATVYSGLGMKTRSDPLAGRARNCPLFSSFQTHAALLGVERCSIHHGQVQIVILQLPLDAVTCSDLLNHRSSACIRGNSNGLLA